jgi:cell division initiation protein
MKEAELKASELLREARVELAETQRDISELRKQRLLMIERLRATIHTFERMLEVEEEDEDSSEAAAPSNKLTGESTRYQ